MRRKLVHEARTKRLDMPLDWMLKVMRDPRANRDRRDKMAIAAAPYVHAKLMTHKIGGPDGGAVPLTVAARVYVFLPDNHRRTIDVTPNDAEQLTEEAAKAGALAIEAAATSAAENEEEEVEEATEG